MTQLPGRPLRALFSGLTCLALSVFIGTALYAQGAYVSTNRFGYSGTIERYNSLSDLQAGINAVSGSPFTVPGRDLSLYIIDGNAAVDGSTYAHSAMFLSAWFTNGGASPSNSNLGFIQMYDVDGGSVTSLDMSWANPARTIFQLALTGGNTQAGCTSSGDCGRLWNVGSPLGSSETTGGLFYSYALGFTASGLTPATWNATTGVYESVSDPTAVTGSLTGIFQNTSTDDPGSNGWYKYNLAMSMDSWAHTNGYDGGPGAFGAPVVTPEPAAMLLLATGFIGLFGIGTLRRRRST